MIDLYLFGEVFVLLAMLVALHLTLVSQLLGGLEFLY